MNYKLYFVITFILLQISCTHLTHLQKETNNKQKNKILPHLEGKITPGENYIYCPTFQMAWDDVTENILNAKPMFRLPCPMADILNRNKYAKENLYPERYYVKSGYIKNGIVELIIRELTEKYGEKEKINKTLRENNRLITEKDFLSFAYLQASPHFEEPFYLFKSPLYFKSNSGETKVEAFGISEFKANDDKGSQSKRYRQVNIIDYVNEDDFIVSISAIPEVNPKGNSQRVTKEKEDIKSSLVSEIEGENSSYEEIIIAKIPPEKNLLKTWKKVLERSKKHKIDYSRQREYVKMIKIPKIDFDIIEEYSELYRNNLKNKGFEILEIQKALQSIAFNLNEKGAEVKSSALVRYGGGAIYYYPPPRYFILDRPFLIALRQYKKAPYLLIWVENSEIMSLWKTTSEESTDYLKLGEADAVKDFTAGKQYRKVAFYDKTDELDNFRAKVYKRYFNIDTKIVKNLKGEALSNYLHGYNEIMKNKLNKKYQTNVTVKAEKILKKIANASHKRMIVYDLMVLSEQQNEDGTWGSEEKTKLLLTSLAILVFSAHGEIRPSSSYRDFLIKGIKKLVHLNENYQKSGLGEIYPDDVILALTLSEIYTISKKPMLKEQVAFAAERALKRKNKNSLWYLLLIRSLANSDAVPKVKVEREIKFLANSIENRLKNSQKNSDLTGFVNAVLTKLYSSREIPNTRTLKFLEKNAPFDWKETLDPKSRERYIAQTLLYLNVRGNEWKKWNKVMTRLFLKSQKRDFLNLKVAYPFKYPEKCKLNNADYQLYNNLSADLLLTVYYRYLPVLKIVKLKDKQKSLP